MIAAFDIDGTIANNDHREVFARNAQWDEFHARAEADRPLEATVAVLNALSHEHVIEIWTARPERYRAETERWLDTHGIPYSRLLMRPDGDWRKAYILKLEWYLTRPATSRPSIVFEDHAETTRLLRAAGATVHQVAEDLRHPAETGASK